MTRISLLLASFAAVWAAPVLALASPATPGEEHGSEHGSSGIKWLGDGFLGGPGADGKTGFLLIIINFVVLMLLLVRAGRQLEIQWSRWAQALPGYLVGSLGAYWTIQRTLVLL